MSRAKISNYLFLISILILSLYFFKVFKISENTAFLALALYIISLVLSFRNQSTKKTKLKGETVVLVLIFLALLLFLLFLRKEIVVTVSTILVVLTHILFNFYIIMDIEGFGLTSRLKKDNNQHNTKKGRKSKR